jgi:hypothetical protein
VTVGANDTSEQIAATATSWVQKEQLALGIVVLTFLTRWLLSDWNSYWLDEIYSVALFGIWQNSLADVAASLQEASIHPPLYQWILFLWMKVFGDSELATRSLSNLYVSGASFFVYLTMRRVVAESHAIIGLLIFSVMGMTMQYGLETRSYAQTLFFVSVSNFALWVLVSADDKNPFIGIRRVPALTVAFANTCLLLTHYYNLFWFAAQGVAAMLLLSVVSSFKAWPRFRFVGITHLLPFGIYLAVWGRVIARQITDRREDFALDDDTVSRTAVDLARTVFDANLWTAIPGLRGTISVFTIAALIASVRAIKQGKPRQRLALAHLHSALMFGGPLAMTWLGFVIAGAERYSTRYFIFSAAALVPMIVFSLAILFDSASENGGIAYPRGRRDATVSSLLALVLVVSALPAGQSSATREKQDWRGITRDVVTYMGESSASTLILETSFRGRPVSAYYFERHTEESLTVQTVQRLEERRNIASGASEGGNVDDLTFRFLRNLDDAQFNEVIVIFTHHRTRDFPLALETLRSRFATEESYVGIDERGFVVFRDMLP